MMQSLLYKLNYHYRVLRKYGLGGMLLLLSLKFSKNRLSNIKIKGVASPLFLSNYGPDITTLLQIFFAKEYNIILKHSPNFIVDCGANIGLSAVYFANKYPEARIIAIEPDITNFGYLKRNSSFYNNIVCLNKAVWSHPTKVSIIDKNVGNWGLSTVESSKEEMLNSIDAVSIDLIMEEFGIPEIDILKVDIEGAEKELFKENFENWLDKTKILAIELHEIEGENIPEIFYKTISNYPHTKYFLGENLICHFDE